VALSRYCLDTSAYSHFKRGHASATRLIDSADWLGVPMIVLGELWTGFLLGGRPEKNATELREFLSSPVVNTLGLDEEVSRIYAEILVSLRRAGTPVPSNDIWIAASAIKAGAAVLTFDTHFEEIRQVRSVVLDPRAV
jgi:tRNA(fMet)-specific endonuclease VapC